MILVLREVTSNNGFFVVALCFRFSFSSQVSQFTFLPLGDGKINKGKVLVRRQHRTILGFYVLNRTIDVYGLIQFNEIGHKSQDEIQNLL